MGGDVPGTDPGEEAPVDTAYTVTFDLAGGFASDGAAEVQLQVDAGALLEEGAVAEPIRTGYLFQGWTDEAGNGFDFSQPIVEDRTVTAAWKPIMYRVRFEANGGTGQMPEQMFLYDEKKPLSLNGFSRKDCVFEGWKLNGLLIGKDGEEVKNLASQEGAVVVLKASWKRGRYEIRYHGNGGTGKVDSQTGKCGLTKKLRKNDFERTGYRFVGWNTKKDGTGVTYKEGSEVQSLSSRMGDVVTLYAMWKGITYKVCYYYFDDKGSKDYTITHVYGVPKKLKKISYKKKGYVFSGWSYWDSVENKVKRVKDQAVVKNLTTKEGQTILLYGEFKPIKYTLTYKTNGGKMAKSHKKKYSIETKTFTIPRPTRKGYDFDGWYKDKKYKKRVGEIKNGSTGNRTFYAKWVKCTRKATSNSAKLTACKAVSKKKVRVKATIKSRVLSSDDYYYLVYVNPVSNTPYKTVKKVYKKKNISFVLPLSENRGYLVSKLGIAVKKNGKFKLISKSSYVKNPEKAAVNKKAYNPGKTKKGMQFYETMDEILACNAKQIFLNITTSMVFNTNDALLYDYNGKRYVFNRLQDYQKIVRECNRRGISVTVQILLDWVGGADTDLISARARVPGAAPFYTWNVTSNSAREKMEAFFSFLGETFGKKDCYVTNWILGNEVNVPHLWNYRGSMSESMYFRTYAHAFRSLYYAVRSQYANASIFICMDNMWNTALAGGFTVKHSIGVFKKKLDEIQKGLKWNLAYHAYSAPSTYTNFWHGVGITNKVSTPYITMKNINVLTNYIKKKYGSSVRILLSEQGYSSTWGQANQAAALAYSYYIAACNPMIDGFIIRSYRDNAVEAAQGLRMGIEGKEAFSVYKNMDTRSSFYYTNKYLRLIGGKSWKKLVPKFKKSRVWKMYRKR